jgi:hypothetical protein
MAARRCRESKDLASRFGDLSRRPELIRFESERAEQPVGDSRPEEEVGSALEQLRQAMPAAGMNLEA